MYRNSTLTAFLQSNLLHMGLSNNAINRLMLHPSTRNFKLVHIVFSLDNPEYNQEFVRRFKIGGEWV